jgi:hypothetical protein
VPALTPDLLLPLPTPLFCAAGHLKKRLPGKSPSDLAASKRLRALAGLALRDDSDLEDDEEEEDDEDGMDDEAPAGSGGRRRQRYGSEDEEEDDEVEGEADEEALLRSLHSGKVARTTSDGMLSPRTASLAQTMRSGGRRGGGDTRRHVTRAATGSLRPRQYDVGGIEAGLDDEQQYLEAASGLEGLSSLAMDPEERYLMQARQHARGLAPGGKAAGSRDSSQHTRSTTEHCSEQDGMLLVGSAAAAAGLAPAHFMRAVSASGSTGGWVGGRVGMCSAGLR